MPGQYAWPVKLADYLDAGGKLDKLEPCVQIWLGELVRDIERTSLVSVQAMTYTSFSGATPDEKLRKVTDFHTRTLLDVSDRIRPQYVRMAARETAFVRYEAELIQRPAVVLAVSAQLSPRLDTIVSVLAGGA